MLLLSCCSPSAYSSCSLLKIDIFDQIIILFTVTFSLVVEITIKTAANSLDCAILNSKFSFDNTNKVYVEFLNVTSGRLGQQEPHNIDHIVKHIDTQTYRRSKYFKHKTHTVQFTRQYVYIGTHGPLILDIRLIPVLQLSTFF